MNDWNNNGCNFPTFHPLFLVIFPYFPHHEFRHACRSCSAVEAVGHAAELPSEMDQWLYISQWSNIEMAIIPIISVICSAIYIILYLFMVLLLVYVVFNRCLVFSVV